MKETIKNKINKEKIKNKLNPKNYNKWNIVSILFGVMLGLISAMLFTKYKIKIFGVSFASIFSPLIAGYAESFLAHHKCKETTGAISALIIFIIVNIQGWIFPEQPISFSILTIGGLTLTIQAAFPIAVNYILYIILFGALGYLGHILSKLTYKLTNKELFASKNEYNLEEIDLTQYNVLGVSTPNIQGKKIIKNYGMIDENQIIKPDMNIFEEKTSEPTVFKQMEYYNKKITETLMKKAESMGANAILDMDINYSDIGGLQGLELIITISGTAVLIE